MASMASLDACVTLQLLPSDLNIIIELFAREKKTGNISIGYRSQHQCPGFFEQNILIGHSAQHHRLGFFQQHNVGQRFIKPILETISQIIFLYGFATIAIHLPPDQSGFEF
jgi:hypothetical protein